MSCDIVERGTNYRSQWRQNHPPGELCPDVTLMSNVLKGDSEDEGCWKFPADHENSLMLKFEMWAPQMFWVWLLSRDGGVSFTETQPGSILTALCSKIAYLLLGKIL